MMAGGQTQEQAVRPEELEQQTSLLQAQGQLIRQRPAQVERPIEQQAA